MLGDTAYDSANLREELGQHGTKPVIPNRCNRRQPFTFNKRFYKLRIESAFNRSAFNRLKDWRIAIGCDRLRAITSRLSALQQLLYGGFDESGP